MIKYSHTDATLSPCGTWRYRLERRWGGGPTALWIMLNPSTADARQDDPTIRRCAGFSVREHCGRMLIGNLFALRATNPAALHDHPDPYGPGNLRHLREMAKEASVIIAAWGAHSFVPRLYVMSVLETIKDCATVRCLGVTKSGAPRHPLYVAGSMPLEDLAPCKPSS